MQSPTYIHLKSSCFTLTELKPFQLYIPLTRTFSAVKMFCLPRFCLCVRLQGSPPNWTGRPRLHRFPVPWSGPAVRLTRSVCRCDTEGTEQFWFTVTFRYNTECTVDPEAIMMVSNMTYKVTLRLAWVRWRCGCHQLHQCVGERTIIWIIIPLPAKHHLQWFNKE